MSVRAKGRRLDPFPDLIPHTAVAAKLGISTALLRAWVQKGEFPRPHSLFAQTWLYRVDVIAAFLETGQWPAGVAFHRPSTRGAGPG